MWSTRIVFALFVLGTPVGMAIGMSIDHSTPNILVVIIQPLSAGVLAYIGCCDLLIHSFHQSKYVSFTNNLMKYISMSVGSGIVIALTAVEPA